MRYENEELGFSHELPDGWRRDDHNLTLTFHGPNGAMGRTTAVIQIAIGGILPEYVDPANREAFLAEPGASVLRTRVGDETNAGVFRKSSKSEISVVRDGVQYTITHANDSATQKAIESLSRSALRPASSNRVGDSALVRTRPARHREGPPGEGTIPEAIRDGAQGSASPRSTLGS